MSIKVPNLDVLCTRVGQTPVSIFNSSRWCVCNSSKLLEASDAPLPLSTNTNGYSFLVSFAFKIILNRVQHLAHSPHSVREPRSLGIYGTVRNYPWIHRTLPAPEQDRQPHAKSLSPAGYRHVMLRAIWVTGFLEPSGRRQIWPHELLIHWSLGGNKVLERIWHSEERVAARSGFQWQLLNQGARKAGRGRVTLAGVMYEKILECQ